MNWKQLITTFLQRRNHQKSSCTSRTMESHRKYRYRWSIKVRKNNRFIPIITYWKHLVVFSRCDDLLIRPSMCKVCTCRTKQDEKRKLVDKRSRVKAVQPMYYSRTRRLSNKEMDRFLTGTIFCSFFKNLLIHGAPKHASAYVCWCCGLFLTGWLQNPHSKWTRACQCCF